MAGTVVRDAELRSCDGEACPRTDCCRAIRGATEEEEVLES